MWQINWVKICNKLAVLIFTTHKLGVPIETLTVVQNRTQASALILFVISARQMEAAL